ncbi:MAG: hypothetical protein ACOCZ9_00410, partial [Spirochaetota bacterium]
MAATGAHVDYHTRTLLEFDRVLEALRSRCMSNAGVRSCGELAPTFEKEALYARLDRVAEYRILLAEG